MIRETSVAPQVPDDCYAGTIETTDAVIGILLSSSNIRIYQSQFEGNKVGLGAVIYNEFTIISSHAFIKIKLSPTKAGGEIG